MAAITDVPGLLVGHAADETALTGCTVVLCPPNTVGAVDVRGGAPGTRETDLLEPTMLVSYVDAIALCGGSAFGLAAAGGVMRRLRELDRGYQTGVARVPIVPAAVLFDLGLGDPLAFPDEAMGYAAACNVAVAVPEGSVGAGIGASAGKLGGMASATKSGLGTWSERLPDGTTVGALVVANPLGDILADGQIIAGLRDLANGGFAGSAKVARMLAQANFDDTARSGNTTLAVIATDATLDKAAATRLARMAHDGLARAIHPVHTPFDGDIVFVLATGARPAPPLISLGVAAVETLQQAIVRAAQTASGRAGLPSGREWI